MLGDPQRGHPVAAYGSAAQWTQERMWADERGRGVLYVGVLVGTVVAAGAAASEIATRARWAGLAKTALIATATWAVLGGRSLEREGEAMYLLLSQPASESAGQPASESAGQPVSQLATGSTPPPASEDSLAAARARLSHLCSRDPAELDADELARATIESLAENTSDAVTAPLIWGALAGVPGLLGYRAVNTLDAMVGYRSPRYRQFGWAAARLDDVLNYVPARVAGLATVALARVVHGSPAQAWRAWRRDSALHPSPNAGVVEATAAGALGRTLGGINTYAGVLEERGSLGDGPAATAADIPRAIRLTRSVGLASLAVAVAVAAGRTSGRQRSARATGRS